MTERYLVTGCAGFIGSRIAQILLDERHAVTGVDSINNAYDPRLKHWRLEQLTKRSNFTFERIDVTDRGAVTGRFAADRERGGNGQGPPYAAIFHLAARAGVRPSVADPWSYLDANALSTVNLLDLCREQGVPKFVLASTSSLYGAHNPIPYREDADTTRPLSPYAASKGAAEMMAYTYHHLHELDVSVLRFFTVYGPAGRPDMSVFRFVQCIAEGKPILVFGDGLQQRDFTYIDDVARGAVAAKKPLGFEVINLGGDKPVRLCDVIDGIARLIGREPVIERAEAHPADVPATWADVTKANELLGWTPKVSVEEGLRRSVQWYIDNREVMREIDLGM